MTDTSWNDLWDVFHQALDLPPEQRDSFLEQRLGEEPDKLAEVHGLLAAEADASGLSLNPPVDTLDKLKALDPEFLIGQTIGGYRIQQVLGEGGMGVVYAAEQTSPIRRRVALKLVRLGMNTREVVARFESERQALALMDHPNIARVLDAGASDDGRPFFIMEYVPGIPLNDYCDSKRLPLQERLKLFTGVCDAIQHAHQKGIIHRDLKPSNILVAEINGVPTPKVIDFGIAKALTQKLTEKTMFTRMGVFMGTPRYMSPEQAEMGALGVDTRSDVYSLGVILYELLTGDCPLSREALAGNSPAEFPKVIRESPVQRPSTRYEGHDDQVTAAAERRSSRPADVRRQIRGDLDWIVLKALEKDRNRRYASAAELAADIAHYFADEPVLANPPSSAYRLGKFVSRHRIGVGVAAVTMLALLASLAGLGWGVIQASRALVVAEAEQQRAQASFDFLAGLLTRIAPDAARGEDPALLMSLLNEAGKTLAATPPADRRVVGDINQTLADAFRALGDYESAQRYAEASLAIWREAAGPDSPPALRAENSLALVLFNRGDFQGSQAMLEAVLAQQAGVLGTSHPDYLATANNLALVRVDLDQTAEAMALYDQIIAEQTALSGADSEDVLRTRHNMAALLNDTGEPGQAEPIARDLLGIHMDRVGANHPDTVAAQGLLASTLLKQGRLQEARVVQRDGLAAAETVLGPGHPDTLGLQLTAAQLLRGDGEAAAAEPVFLDAYRKARTSLGPRHRLTLSALLGLSEALLAQGNTSDAAARYTEAADLARDSLPQGHRLRSMVTARQGAALLANQQPAEAILKLTDSYPALVEALGRSNPLTRATLRDIVNTYELLEQPEMADRYREEIFKAQ